MLGRLGLALAAIVAAFAITGVGTHHPQTSGPESRAAAHAVAVLTGLAEGDPAAAIPADFADVMRYRPVAATAPDGSRVLIKPTGECSSPLGPTTYDFDVACSRHDLGYDLLRYAARTGGELGPWARRAIDAQLAGAMTDQCAAVEGGPVCHAVAWLSGRVVQANSWRQGHGVPAPEDGTPYVLAAGLIGAGLAGPTIAGRLRARIQRTRSARLRVSQTAMSR